jgi:hypothetical protein
MPRDYRDRSGRVLSKDERKQLRKRAKAIRKTQPRAVTKGEYLQYTLVVLIILGIIAMAYYLSNK